MQGFSTNEQMRKFGQFCEVVRTSFHSFIGKLMEVEVANFLSALNGDQIVPDDFVPSFAYLREWRERCLE
jgi:hypothetical protein